jgi:hypothetical protein
MAELTQKQQKILIEYCEKIKGIANFDEFKKMHRMLLSIPQYEFLKDHLPPEQDDWADYKRIINNIKHREAKEYRKDYGSQGIQPACRLKEFL